VTTFDAIVIGLGAMGSAATYQLAAAGATVLGLDQHAIGHDLGSSHGETRVTRRAVGEGPAYAPLVARSHVLWREIEEEAQRTLLVECGGLIMGVPGATGQHGAADFVEATRAVAVAQGIPHEVLGAAEIRDRFGVFEVADETAVYEPGAGYLRAEACLRAQLALAVRHGATVRTGERVLTWRSDGSSVQVVTPEATHTAGALVIAAGPWIGQLVPELARVVSVQREVLYWFGIERDFERCSDLPVFIWMHGTVPGEFAYGFPAIDGPSGGLKLSTEVFGDATTPETVDRTVSASEIARMHERHVRGRLPGLASTCVRTEVCLYTVTADFGFVIDRHPAYANVIVASPCSGHGFKHSAAIGEAVAQLATGAESSVDLSTFRLDRVALAG
jgi:sarcosine oxidase